MPIKQTEVQNRRAMGLDAQEPDVILNILLDGQISATEAVRSAIPAIEKGAQCLAASLRGGGKVAYVGAGSSGLMAMADGLELPGTFGISHENIKILFAGGADCLAHLKGGVDDDEALAEADVEGASLKSGDCAILVSASGQTPYTLAALRLLKIKGVATIALANNENTDLLNDADIPILLPTGSEVLAGSTRLGAGTAQKIALNMMSTLMGVHLGHVYDGKMVNLIADNAKLKARAERIVTEISGCTALEAEESLEAAQGNVKSAILIISSGMTPQNAEAKLAECNGHVRAALNELSM